MSRSSLILAATCLALGASALLPMPAYSGTPEPPTRPSLEADFIIPPAGTPRTKMPRVVGVPDSTKYKQGIYDVHILAVATTDGPPPWGEAEARRQVEAMDAWFVDVTRGLYRFRLAGYQVLPDFPGQMCGLDQALVHAAPSIMQIQPTAGATDVLPVVLSLYPEGCKLGGQAWLGSPGAWVSARSSYTDTGLGVLIHEIGHNLGLKHSGAIDPMTSGSDPWPLGAMPSIVEYGDGSDVMGEAVSAECTWSTCDIRPPGLHAHNRNLLGSLAPEEISFVGRRQVDPVAESVELVALSSDDSGIRALYLPWLNRSKFVVEFRTAVGRDGWLDKPWGARSGVVVRLVNSDLAIGPDPYPIQDRSTVHYGTIAWPSGRPSGEASFIPLGLRVGDAARLPDGTSVEVTASTATGATVRVARPADSVPPTMSTPRIEYKGGACTQYPCTVPLAAGQRGRYLVKVVFGTLDDNEWVKSTRVAVNGRGVYAEERPNPDGTDVRTSMSPGSTGWGGWQTYAAGVYTVTYTYTDLAGNQGTSSYVVTLPKPKKGR